LKRAVLLPHNTQQQWQPMHSLTSSKPSSPSSGHVTGTEVNYCHEGRGYHHGAELGKIPFHTSLSDTPYKMKNSLRITVSTPQRCIILGSVNFIQRTSKLSYVISLANKTDTKTHKDDRNAYYCLYDKYNETACWQYKNAPSPPLKHTYLSSMFCIQFFFVPQADVLFPTPEQSTYA
jgi:hypothetical protein